MKNFNTIKKPLSKEEKLIRAIEYYTYDKLDFELEYISNVNDDELSEDELDKMYEALEIAVDNDDYEEIERLSNLNPYIEPVLDIKKNYDKLDAMTKKLVDDFVKRDVYEESVVLKCLKCNHEEVVEFDIVDECWDKSDEPDYPTSYCPKCDKAYFVPLDIYNAKMNK